MTYETYNKTHTQKALQDRRSSAAVQHWFGSRYRIPEKSLLDVPQRRSTRIFLQLCAWGYLHTCYISKRWDERFHCLSHTFVCVCTFLSSFCLPLIIYLFLFFFLHTCVCMQIHFYFYFLISSLITFSVSLALGTCELQIDNIYTVK